MLLATTTNDHRSLDYYGVPTFRPDCIQLSFLTLSRYESREVMTIDPGSLVLCKAWRQ